ncbi:ABC transporter ATP-binding protein [Halosimplex pelagicum]|uniref:ABC transporter ATP-binding protein n=1 Tax=Halosimplex pelagicum TaxID=869886 RepID=A0A7D5P5E6_9EURY|nr:ABC transporter ATP-binding protein [Halosimplex pelagicum]QLH81337.1 ABC transporter ATP-binding protein [Halosimplex pelagicum]
MTSPVLEAEGVSIERAEQPVLDGVSLTINAGEGVLVQGPSGSGKSTLFSVLGLLAAPDSGSVTVAGDETSDLSERGRARLRREVIGYVYQDFKLVPDLTARENAALPQDHTGQRDEAWLDELFERLDIADLENRHPPALSGGEKQRVATARALANRPEVVLADEPAGHLDPEASESLLGLLQSLRSDFETALVVVSHDRSLVDRFPQVYHLEDGTLTPLE